MEKIQKLVMSKNKIAGGSWIRGITVRERENRVIRVVHEQSAYKDYELSRN